MITLQVENRMKVFRRRSCKGRIETMVTEVELIKVTTMNVRNVRHFVLPTTVLRGQWRKSLVTTVFRRCTVSSWRRSCWMIPKWNGWRLVLWWSRNLGYQHANYRNNSHRKIRCVDEWHKRSTHWRRNKLRSKFGMNVLLNDTTEDGKLWKMGNCVFFPREHHLSIFESE